MSFSLGAWLDRGFQTSSVLVPIGTSRSHHPSVIFHYLSFLVTRTGKDPPAMQETWI